MFIVRDMAVREFDIRAKNTIITKSVQLLARADDVAIFGLPLDYVPEGFLKLRVCRSLLELREPRKYQNMVISHFQGRRENIGYYIFMGYYSFKVKK